MKFFLFFFLSLFVANSFAQTTGTGCNIGGQVAMQYLGDNSYYGNTSKMVKVYRNTNYVTIIRDSGYGGYQCGKINVYPGGNRWDPATNSNKPYPGVNEIISEGSGIQCVVAATQYGTPTGEGSLLQYSYLNPTYCQVPIDNGTLALLLASGGVGFFFISRKLRTMAILS